VCGAADVARDTKLLWAQLDAFSSRKLSSLNDIPASFLKNPQTNFAAYAEKAKVRAARRARRPLLLFFFFS
jgi:hypothetical protein